MAEAKAKTMARSFSPTRGLDDSVHYAPVQDFFWTISNDAANVYTTAVQNGQASAGGTMSFIDGASGGGSDATYTSAANLVNS